MERGVEKGGETGVRGRLARNKWKGRRGRRERKERSQGEKREGTE